MARFRNNLRRVQVAAPCKVSWDNMLGDERVRFCGQCSLNVYNLSSMSRADAEALIARTEGRLCVKFYRRFDGSIITKDCPIGLQAIKHRVSYAWQALVSVTLTFLAGFGIHQAFSSIPPLVRERTLGVLALRENREAEIVGTYVVDTESSKRPLRKRDDRPRRRQ
ncbi:MAG TPA: hypothetical protein VJT71_09905 [Pyrinomonadaceae bacterium]|nr:hypothetical protein [Pyrinomonadaceae bacterium]